MFLRATCPGHTAPPHCLQVRTLIEGESLLNDASAFVLFEVLLEVMSIDSETPTVLGSILKATRLSVGGCVVGCLLGLLCALLISGTNDAVTEISIALSGMYIGYLFAQAMGFSGVLAVVVFGLLMCAVGSSYISPSTVGPKHRFMEQVHTACVWQRGLHPRVPSWRLAQRLLAFVGGLSGRGATSTSTSTSASVCTSNSATSTQKALGQL